MARTLIVLEVAFLVVCLVSTAAASQSSWVPTQTVDGHPDLQGMWTNLPIRPFERPESMEDRVALSKDEAASGEALTGNFEVTATDLEMYTLRWTVAMPLTRDHSYVMYENRVTKTTGQSGIFPATVWCRQRVHARGAI